MRVPTPHRRPRLAAGLAIAVGATAAVTVTGLTLAPTAQAASACRATYVANVWSGGFTATVRLTAGDIPLNNWKLTWNYGGDQRITNAWNAQVTQTGAAVTAVNMSYNGTVPAGGSVEFGVQGTYATSYAPPTGISIPSAGCEVVVPTVPPPTTTPPPTTPPPTTPPPTTPPPTTPPPTTPPPTTPPPTTPPPTTPPPTTPPPTTPPPTTPPPGTGCGTAAFCDGFEDQTGSTPSGSWGVNYPDCQGTGTASIDSAVAHQGTRSVRVNGATGYCNHVFVRANRDLSGLGAVRYARFWVRHTTALPTQHVTFLAMRDANDGNRDLRMGGQNGALQWNRASDDATLPEQSPAGVALSMPLPTNRWTCVEFLVDGVQGRLQTWVDGTAVTGLAADGTPTHDIDGQWLNRTNWRPNLTDLRLGWESYGEGADTLWFDDVAMGSARIGC